MLYEQIVKEAYLWSRKNRMEDRGRKAQNLSLSHSVSLKYLLHSRAENLSISEEKKKSKPEYKLTATSGFRKLLWYFYMPVEMSFQHRSIHHGYYIFSSLVSKEAKEFTFWVQTGPKKEILQVHVIWAEQSSFGNKLFQIMQFGAD